MKVLILLFALLAVQAMCLSLESESHEAMVSAATNTFQCDGNSYKCKVRLNFGRNNYWAWWSVHVGTNPP